MGADDLGDRIKRFENCYNTTFPDKMFYVYRLDGKGFHSLTKSCQKPFDEKLISLMNDTAIHLCENIQGSLLSYVASDEISILVYPWKNANSQAWFDNKLNKILSISAGLASSYFSINSNKVFDIQKLVCFDSRAFVLPKEEIVNYFYWRQVDWQRNSIQLAARSFYSHKQLNNKKTKELLEMIKNAGSSWEELPNRLKRGRCGIKTKYEANGAIRNKWEIDNEIPIFIENRDYIQNLFEKEETK